MITEENKGIEVFGTVEVSVKEFMGLSKKNLVVLENYDKAKENLLELKSKHEARITELIAKERLSKEELKELTAIRGELRSPRYLIQNFKKDNVSVFATYSKNDKSKWDDLIEINEPLEDTADVKIKAEEAIIQAEKDAEAKAEELRVEKIKEQIDNIETYCSEIVQKMTFDNMKVSAESIEQSLNAEYEFEEYDLLLDQVKGRVTKLLLDKTNDITTRENQRLENEAMKQEIFESRVIRLKELEPNIDSNAPDFSFYGYNLKSIFDATSTEFEKIISDAKESISKAEQAKHDAEIKREKDKQFDVRKNRLAELYPNYNFDVPIFSFYGFTNKEIYDADIITFETIMQDAKKAISDAKEQKELADKKAIADKKKADAENKARVKRLANDKETLSTSIELYFERFEYESDNEETKQFISFANLQLGQLKADLLTQLNEL